METTIRSDGIRIGFFAIKTDAQHALMKYVERGTLEQEED